MQLIDQKKTMALFLMLALGLVVAICKKFFKYPGDIFGILAVDNSDRSFLPLSIDKYSKGNYKPSGVCGKRIRSSGEVCFKNDAIYVGASKPKLKSKLKYAAVDDSTSINYTCGRT